MKITPALKGFITAIVMIVATLIIDRMRDSVNPAIQYLIYGLYAIGIIWTLVSFVKSSGNTHKFAELFSQGFKCFVVVTLMMIAFTIVFLKLHPEFGKQEEIATREYYIKQGDKTPLEIEDMAKKAKKQYPVAIISVSVFKYLIIGAVVTAASSAFLIRRK